MHRLGELSRSYASHVARLFLLEIFIMNKQYAKFLASLRTALTANQKAGEALAEYRPIYNKLSPETQFVVRLEVAGEIADAFECEVRESVYRGEKTIAFDGDRKSDARNALRYYFPVKSDSRGSNNKADPVADLLKKFNALSAGEKRRFLKAI